MIEGLTAQQRPLPNERYDIVAMDPRGVGQSRPVIGCGTDIGRTGLDLMRFPRQETFSADVLIAGDRTYAARCAARNGELLEHVSTANVAYAEAVAMRRELGKGRLLTQRGDGHTAYPGSSPCVDAAIDTSFLRGRLPAPGKTCDQTIPFSSAAR